MGPRRLKEIQEETLYAVDTKYRYMKNTMKISGVAGTILLGTAALFKIQHWPGAGIMMTLGALVLAILFLPSALGVLWKETHSSKRLILFLSAFITGILFIFGVPVQNSALAWCRNSFNHSCSFRFVYLHSITACKQAQGRGKQILEMGLHSLAAIGSACYALGLLFKIQHWPLATTLMIIGLLLLFFYSIPMVCLAHLGKMKPV